MYSSVAWLKHFFLSPRIHKRKYYVSCGHVGDWNNVNEKTVGRPSTSTTRTSLSSAVCPRIMSLSSVAAPIYASRVPLEPSAPPSVACCLAASPPSEVGAAASSSADESQPDFRPCVACGHCCCRACSGAACVGCSTPAANGVGSGVAPLRLNRTCVCGANSVFDAACSAVETDDELLPPPSYEVSQRLHGQRADERS